MPETRDLSRDLRDRLQKVLGTEFALERELQGGAMSVVFLATQPALGRRVVIKVLPRELAGAEALSRFRQEIAVIVAVQHPQIVPLIAAGEVDGLPYFVMPFVDGESLRERLRRGPLSMRETVTILADVTRALAHAHRMGVVHRDIKPANILLTASSAVVADFGVARAVSSGGGRRPAGAPVADGGITSAGTSLGTPAYMAPEQAAGDPDTDHRADLYALGIAAYEMLAGAPPFAGASPQKLLTAQLTEPPPPLARRRADVPVRVEELIRWCLEKEPGNRPPGAAEVLDALQDPELLTAARGVRRTARGAATAAHTSAGFASQARRIASAVAQDLVYAARGLRLRPGFTASVAVTLALAIGANSTMFSLLDRLLLRPPAQVRDPESVVRLTVRRAGREQLRGSFSFVNIADFRSAVPSFEQVAGVTSGRNERTNVSLGTGPTARSARVVLSTANYFATLGVRPAAGRFFTQADDVEGSDRSAVIGHGFWQRRFGGSPEAIGSDLDIAGMKFRIVGVAPAGFSGIELDEIDAWLPIAAAAGLRFDRTPNWRQNRRTTWVQLVARIRPGRDPRLAAAEATTALRAFERDRAIAEGQRPQLIAATDSISMDLVSLVPGKSLAVFSANDLPRDVWVAKLLFAMSAVVLVIACANIANLLLVRALRRRKEIAVRLALGISAGRLTRALLLEGVLLATLGAVGAVLVATWGMGAVRGLLFGESEWAAGGLDARMLLFTALLAVATGIVTALVPALHARRTDLASVLKQGQREGSGHRNSVRGALVFVQAALALVLLVGSGLFVRSINNARNVPVGVDLDHVLIGRVTFAADGPATVEGERAKRQLFDQFVARVRELPGVQAAAITVALPFESSWNAGAFLPGRPLPPTREGATNYAVTPAYFETMGIRRLQGRLFTDSDRLGTELVTIVNDVAAEAYWPGRSPLGECLKIGADTMPCSTVVGVVSGTRRQALIEGPTPQVYIPLDQITERQLTGTVAFIGQVLVVRTTQPAAAAVGAVRTAMQAAAANVPYPQVRAMRDLTARFTRTLTLGARLFTAFGALALVLSVLGLFGVLSYTVAQRLPEMGVRAALGAQTSDLLRMTMVRGLVPVLAGLLTGALVVVLGGRFVAPLLFGVSPRDPAIIATGSAVLLTAAIVASAIPAWRASRVDPAIVLRSE